MNSGGMGGFKKIWIIIIIALVGIGAYYLAVKNHKPASKEKQLRETSTQQSFQISPTSSLTGSWKTYSDARYGFSFMYPQYWTFNTNFTPNGGMNPFIFTINTTGSSRDPLRMAISIENNDKKWTLNQWFADVTARSDSTLPQKQISIGGYQAIKTRTFPHLEDYFIVAPGLNTTKTNALYDIFFTNDGEGMNNPNPDTDPFVQQELANFHRVLSSFRFPK